jgi:hypothetical protein
MAITLVQQTFIDSLLFPMDDEQLLHSPLAQVRGFWRLSRCLLALESLCLQTHPVTNTLRLTDWLLLASALLPTAQVPPPMFDGNWEASNLVCILGEQLPASVAHNSGFDWVNEGSATKPKWGFVSWTVGARLVLKVDTRASAGHQVDAALLHQQPVAAAPAPGSNSSSTGSSSMIVWVGYVKSWRYMGTASLTCIGGCTCQPTAVDGMHELGNTQQHMAKLYTTQAQECLIEVKVWVVLSQCGCGGGLVVWMQQA